MRCGRGARPRCSSSWNYCEECDKSGSVLDPAKDAQLLAEFQNVQEALTHFDQVYGRITEMARQVRFTVAPRNEPTPSDPHAAMSLYSNLNRSLAAACPAAQCWGAPSSSATLIPSWVEVFKQEDTDRAARGEAKPVPKARFGGIVGMSGMGGGWSPQPGWGTLAAMGASMPTLIEGYTPGHLERSCGVAQSYERLKADHLRSSH